MVAFHALRGLTLLPLVLLTAQAARKRSPIGTSNMTQVEARDHVSNSHVAEAEVEEAVDDAPTLAEVVAEEADQEAAENSVGLLVRRRRRARRRRDRRRRRLITRCNRQHAVVSSLNRCCFVAVEGHWSTLRSVSAKQTISISYGYSSNVQTFDLVSVYQSSMVEASAGFIYKGIFGSASASSSAASSVVSTTYINTAVDFNMTWTAEWTNKDGSYLYQWVWTIKFGGNGDRTCQGVADAQIGTQKIVQADKTPSCLPGYNMDGNYTQCYPEGLLR